MKASDAAVFAGRTDDPEREVTGAIPIESPAVSEQGLAGNGLIDRDIRQRRFQSR